jgi:uncharacterized DUF497 family protein
MFKISFKWDPAKNILNQRMHGISFEEAQTVFYDENAGLIPVPMHSETEERFILLGFSSKAHLLIVCHCYRKNDKIIRLISARKSNKKESIQYIKFKG